MCIDEIVVSDLQVFISPDMFSNRTLGKNPSLVCNEIFQQLVFFIRQFNCGAIYFDQSFLGIEPAECYLENHNAKLAARDDDTLQPYAIPGCATGSCGIDD